MKLLKMNPLAKKNGQVKVKKLLKILQLLKKQMII